MSVEIRVEGVDKAISSMREALDALGGKQAGKAVANAMNQSLRQGRREASREARKAYTAPIKKLFDSINLRRASGASMQGQLELSAKKGVNLIHFKALPNIPQPPKERPAVGVTAQKLRKGPRKVARSDSGGSKSFIMKKRSGGADGGFGVFVRHKRKTDPFEMLMGPSPIQALQRKDVQENVATVIEDTFKPRLQDEIDKALAAAVRR